MPVARYWSAYTSYGLLCGSGSSGFVFRDLGFRFRVSGFEIWVSGFGVRFSGFRLRIFEERVER